MHKDSGNHKEKAMMLLYLEDIQQKHSAYMDSNSER